MRAVTIVASTHVGVEVDRVAHERAILDLQAMGHMVEECIELFDTDRYISLAVFIVDVIDASPIEDVISYFIDVLNQPSALLIEDDGCVYEVTEGIDHEVGEIMPTHMCGVQEGYVLQMSNGEYTVWTGEED